MCSHPPPKAPFSDLILPFNAKTTVYCTHSSGVGSHAWNNSLFAIDLANKYEEPAPEVIAAKEGKAFVFLGDDGKLCPTLEDSPQNSKTDNCGNGWGNHIKILHDDGYYSFYAHLEKVYVKTGDFVKKGQPIGVMGNTGLAGHRHLHWSLQKVPGNTQADWGKNILTYDGQSVPFDFTANSHGQIQTFNTQTLICPHANIGMAPEDKQPQFNGVIQ